MRRKDRRRVPTPAALRRLAIVAAMVLAAAADASPLLELPTAGERCEPEIERFCAGVPARNGALASCLAARRLELSGECLGGLAAREVRRWAWREVCHGDLSRFCLQAMRHDERALGFARHERRRHRRRPRTSRPRAAPRRASREPSGAQEPGCATRGKMESSAFVRGPR